MIPRRWAPAAVLVGSVAACAAAGTLISCEGDPAPDSAATHAWSDCQGTDQAFVRRAIRGLVGRLPWGQAEVNAYADLVQRAKASGSSQRDALQVAARLIMADEHFNAYWGEFFKDALNVLRTPFVRNETYDLVQTHACYAVPATRIGGALAAWVRDNSPSSNTPPAVEFSMGQLLNSSLELDDLSPIYRAHLFQMLTTPLAGANVDVLELERARRHDFGTVFERAYIHRDPECMPCHNSQLSVTFSSDPKKNRAWPVPGAFEESLYGIIDGPFDAIRSRSVLRHIDVADAPAQAPWGWSAATCGTMRSPTEPDPLGVDAYFGSIRSTPDEPLKGQFASVWTLELALRRGFDSLAKSGLRREGEAIPDPDQAFAYLVAQNIVEQVWAEVVGTRLTIANYFPRTEVQRDVLQELTRGFIESRYSLKKLLLEIVVHPAFNLQAPDEGCGDAAYEMPRLFDPWTDGEAPERQPNSPADAVHAASARPLRAAFHLAMHWPPPSEFPRDAKEESEHRLLGMFISNGEPGFRGLDFQGKLTWESLYANCRSQEPRDFVADLVDRARRVPGATLRDAVVALKDRLVGEPWIDDSVERPALEALVGAGVDSTDLTRLDEQLRATCGALILSPQFLLKGIAPRDAEEVPKLTPPERDYGATCATLAERAASLDVGYAVRCGSAGSRLEIERR